MALLRLLLGHSIETYVQSNFNSHLFDRHVAGTARAHIHLPTKTDLSYNKVSYKYTR